MTIANQLQQQLENTFLGKPWYGTPVSVLITQENWVAAFNMPPGVLHSVAHLVLHMTAWTEEVTSRLQGNAAAEPARGDWPDPGAASEQKWHALVIDLDEANSNLVKALQAFSDNKWNDLIDDQRGVFEPKPTYLEMVQGLIEHQIYHAGQIALLNRINNVS
jgi:uncharacterized damage-inducible protein DinB